MRTNTNQFAKEVPLPSNYGAAELIILIRRNTFKSFVSASLILSIALTGFYLYLKAFTGIDVIEKVIDVVPPSIINIADKIAESEPQEIELPPVPNSIPASALGTGLKEVAGNFVGVEDSKLLHEVEVANFDRMGFARSVSGNGTLAQTKVIDAPATTEQTPKMVEMEKSNIMDNPDIIIPVDKEPNVDMAKLARCVEYPQLAIKAGISGKVFVSVLIDELGNILKTKIAHSDNMMLNQAAIDAVRKYGQYEPARQKGQAVKYWLSIPIDFRLK